MWRVEVAAFVLFVVVLVQFGLLSSAVLLLRAGFRGFIALLCGTVCGSPSCNMETCNRRSPPPPHHSYYTVSSAQRATVCYFNINMYIYIYALQSIYININTRSLSLRETLLLLICVFYKGVTDVYCKYALSFVCVCVCVFVS